MQSLVVCTKRVPFLKKPVRHSALLRRLELDLTKAMKTLLICGSVLGIVLWLAAGKSSQAFGPGGNSLPVTAQPEDNGYVGADACKDCHEDQFKNYSHTSHAKLAGIKATQHAWLWRKRHQRGSGEGARRLHEVNQTIVAFRYEHDAL